MKNLYSKNLYSGNKWASQLPLSPWLLIYLLLGSIAAIPEARAQLSATVQTSQTSYVLGQRIELSLSAFNDSDQDITLQFPSTFQANYALDGAPLNACCGFGFTVFSEAIVPAQGSHTWDFSFTGIDVGPHQVVGYIAPRRVADSLNNGLEFFTAPGSFDVTAPNPVVDDVIIDFETYPDGTSTRGPNGTKGIWEDAYAQWGVHLNTTGGTSSSLGINLDDNFSSDNTILHTVNSRRNIKAEFDMPVFEVAANVGTAQGRSVVMTIFDTKGNVIDTIESANTDNYPAFSDLLKLTSTIPIAAVEWAASDPLATVRIDDIYLDVRSVPEPTSLALIACGVLLGFGRRAKGH